MHKGSGRLTARPRASVKVREERIQLVWTEQGVPTKLCRGGWRRMERENEAPGEFSNGSPFKASALSIFFSDSLTCWQVGRRRTARFVAVIFPTGLVRSPDRAAVSVALFHRPGAGLPLTFHESLTAAHLLQEAFLHVLWLYPGFLLLPGGG